MNIRLLTFLLIFVTGAFAWGAISVDTSGGGTGYDSDFVNSLREMRLYRLARVYLSEQLTQADLPPQAQARLTAALIEVMGEQALSGSASQQDEINAQSQKIARDYLDANTDNPYRIWILFAQLQDAVNAGELGAMNVQLRPGDETTRQAALNQLRRAADAAAELEKILDNPSNALDVQSKQKAIPDAQWQAIQNQTQFLAARGAMAMAQCYPANSPEFTDGATQAIARLKLLGGLPNTNPLCWRARLFRVRATRLSGDVNAAQNAIGFMLEKQKPPEEMLLDFQAEKLNLLMQSNRVAALETLTQLQQGLINTFPQSDSRDDDAHLAVLHALITLEKEAAARGNEPERKKYQDDAIQWADNMRRYDSGFYARSAQQILAAMALKSINSSSSQPGSALPGVNSEENSTPNADAQLIALAAENLFRSGQYNQAIETYQKAAQAAENKAEEIENAFKYRYIAAAIAHQQNDHAQAVTLFRNAAVKYPQHPQAQQALKSAIYHAGKLINPEDSSTIQTYAELLDEFLSLFPNSDSAEQMRQQRLQTALMESVPARRFAIFQKLLSSMTGKESSFNSLWNEGMKSADAALALAKEEGRDAAAMAGEYIQWLYTLPVVKNQKESPTADLYIILLNAQLKEALWRSEFTNQTPLAITQVQQALNQSAQFQSPEITQWKSHANALQVSLFVAQGKTEEALGLMNQLAGAGTDELLNIARVMSQQVSAMPPQSQSAAAAAVLKTIALIESRQAGAMASNQNEQVQLQLCKANMLLLTRQASEALKIFQPLAQNYPQNAEIQTGFAQALSDSGDSAGGLTQWRNVAQNTKQYSPEWYRAKYEVARLLVKTGQKPQAVKMVNLLKLLRPDLGGNPWKEKFEKILSE